MEPSDGEEEVCEECGHTIYDCICDDDEEDEGEEEETDA